MTVIGTTEATAIGEVDSVQTRKGVIEVVQEIAVDAAEAGDIDIRLCFCGERRSTVPRGEILRLQSPLQERGSATRNCSVINVSCKY